MRTEDERAGRLLDAQAKAVALFDEVVATGIIAAGQGEQAASDQIRDLANEMFGTTKHWHKRIVRSGPHTLFPYRENPPDRIIEADDIAFADFGPIFEEFEADLGRTYVLGEDPVKHRLAADLPVIFGAGRRYFASHPAITGAQLYAEVGRLARAAGWSLGNVHAGHLVGNSRTRRSMARTSSPTSPPATPPSCAATTSPGGYATGSWRSTSLTPPAGSAASTSSFLTSADGATAASQP
jgi:Xaa-Pro aminopeptidase